MPVNEPQQSLFEQTPGYRPLADRMRPHSFDECVGQSHLIDNDKPLRRAIEGDHLHSMVFWGPPGTGKTTLARLVANYCGAEFLNISAILSGVKEIRAAIDRAKLHRDNTGGDTVLFVDEVHRFNKSQQDAFLPFIEDGSIYFIGATTENPSFELNNALLSRLRVYVLKSINAEDIVSVLNKALIDADRGLGANALSLTSEQLNAIAVAADGDVRRALNLLEIAADLAETKDERNIIADDVLNDVIAQGPRRFDKGGDLFYEQISALHKSVRGSDPDATLYWFARMLDGGCDPLYIARRVVRMASEDIGNADPRGLQLALNAWDVYERLGSPEGELAIAQAIVYLACAPKSNAVYKAYNAATRLAAESGSLEVPMHLRNAPTKMMKQMDYGKDYDYSHDSADAFSEKQKYFPEQLGQPVLYKPVPRGLEIKIAERLAELRRRRR
ncbi:MAG: replication-associated recombination protein A [Gammaproteobacteria bacterium]|nr:replication-associated recombination protein A [Gammaproteobacteria bacterium]